MQEQFINDVTVSVPDSFFGSLTDDTLVSATLYPDVQRVQHFGIHAWEAFEDLRGDIENAARRFSGIIVEPIAHETAEVHIQYGRLKELVSAASGMIAAVEVGPVVPNGQTNERTQPLQSLVS